MARNAGFAQNNSFKPMNPTPTQALELLDRAVATVQTDRAGHVNIQLALKALADLIESTKPKPVETPKE